jgi:hypothetical protein
VSGVPWRKKPRPLWVEALDCPHPNGVRASARIWRFVCLELGVWTFDEMPQERKTLQAIVDRIKAANPPTRGRNRLVIEIEIDNIQHSAPGPRRTNRTQRPTHRHDTESHTAPPPHGAA